MHTVLIGLSEPRRGLTSNSYIMYATQLSRRSSALAIWEGQYCF